jgi:hypothetical protein
MTNFTAKIRLFKKPEFALWQYASRIHPASSNRGDKAKSAEIWRVEQTRPQMLCFSSLFDILALARYVWIDEAVQPGEKVYRMSVDNFVLGILLPGCLRRGEMDRFAGGWFFRRGRQHGQPVSHIRREPARVDVVSYK